MYTLIHGKTYLINGEKLTFVDTLNHGEVTVFEKEDGTLTERDTEDLFDVEIEKIERED